MQRRRPPRRQKQKESKKEEDDAEVTNIQVNNYQEDDKFYEKWAGPVLIGPFFPAIFAFFVIIAGQLVLATSTGTCGYDLASFVSAMIATSYLFLLIFSWVYFGDTFRLKIEFFSIDMVVLAPFKSMKWIMYYYGIVAFMSFIVGIVGAVTMSMAIFCVTTSPELYTFSLFLVVMYWLGFFIVGTYIFSLFFGGHVAELIKEQMREETLEEVEERLFREKFQVYDREREDRITREQFPLLLQDLGIFVPADEQNQLQDTFDPDNTGFLAYEEVKEWFKSLNAEANKHDKKIGNLSDDDDDEDDK